VVTNLPVEAKKKEVSAPNSNPLLAYIFRFVDPVAIGKELQHFGYTPQTEIQVLVDIAKDTDSKYGPYARMGAIKMLQDMRNRALELSGAIVHLTEERHNKDGVEAMRTRRVVQNVSRYQIGETDERLPGDHKPPIDAGTIDVSVVPEGGVPGSAGPPDSSGEVPEKTLRLAEGSTGPGGEGPEAGSAEQPGEASGQGTGGPLEERLDGAPGVPHPPLEGTGQDTPENGSPHEAND